MQSVIDIGCPIQSLISVMLFSIHFTSAIQFILFSIVSFRAILFTVHQWGSNGEKAIFTHFHPHSSHICILHSLQPHFFINMNRPTATDSSMILYTPQLDINDFLVYSHTHPLTLYQSFELVFIFFPFWIAFISNLLQFTSEKREQQITVSYNLTGCWESVSCTICKMNFCPSR